MERTRHLLTPKFLAPKASFHLRCCFAQPARKIHLPSAALPGKSGADFLKAYTNFAAFGTLGATKSLHTTPTILRSNFLPSSVASKRCLSTEQTPAQTEADLKGSKRKPMFLLLSGNREPQPIEISLDDRVIVSLEPTIKILEADLSKTIQGVYSTLNDGGLHEIRWPPGADDDVASYVLAHEYTAVESSYEYTGAFSIGVKRVKVLSLASLTLTSLGGPLLVIGEANPTAMQWGLAAAVVFFGVSTTGLLHIITSPYVISLRRLADHSFEAETPLLTGGTVSSRFTAQDVVVSSSPFSTFTAKGRSFFVHKELFLGDEAQDLLCDLLGDKAAEDMYTTQLAKDPSDPDALYNYGRFLWLKKGDPAAAQKEVQKVLDVDPADEGALQLLESIKAEKKE